VRQPCAQNNFTGPSRYINGNGGFRPGHGSEPPNAVRDPWPNTLGGANVASESSISNFGRRSRRRDPMGGRHVTLRSGPLTFGLRHRRRQITPASSVGGRQKSPQTNSVREVLCRPETTYTGGRWVGSEQPSWGDKPDRGGAHRFPARDRFFYRRRLIILQIGDGSQAGAARLTPSFSKPINQ